MENSMLIARLMGPFIVLIGVGLLFNTKVFVRIMTDFFKSPALIYISGLITFVAGLAVVLFNNIWVADWRVIITIFGWMTLIKGAWLTVLPDMAIKMARTFKKNLKLAMIPWSIMVILGISLIFKGYGG